jgi:hypothetical protein
LTAKSRLTGPFPLASTPWHEAQYFKKSSLPASASLAEDFATGPHAKITATNHDKSIPIIVRILSLTTKKHS